MGPLTGGQGTDALYGNSGGGADGAVDTFAFTNNWGTDFVFDFEVGTDKLDMTGVSSVFTATDLTITSNSGNAIISFGGNVISVAGRAGQITANDFVFDSFAVLAPDVLNSGGVGASVAAAGDINNDGFDDVIVGAPEAGSGSGAVYIVYGHAHGNVDLSSPGANVTVLTASGETGFGSQVAKVGDFNGDALDDLLITNDEGTAYFVLGRPGGFGASLDVATDPQVYTIDLGFSDGFRTLTTAGDVNGDGLDDVLLTRDRPARFSSYLIYGTPGTGGSIIPPAETFPE